MCKHINKKNLSSNKITKNESLIVVRCLDCNMYRYESRDLKNKSVSTSEWKK